MDEERRRALEEAALEAEMETGRHEETLEEARRSLLVRLVRIGIGFAVLLVGVALLALPGPGLVVVAVGLAILAPEIPFAERLLENVNERIPRDQDGRLPLRAKVMLAASILFACLLTAVSVWWSFFR